ncbi:unnamed protein product, partial [Vitis vinifera]
MEVSSLHTPLSLLFVFLLLAFGIFFPRRRRYGNLPPSPPALPIIGHLHLLKQPVHRSLQRLSQKYGPIFSLRFGSQLAVIVSSPSAVEECFTKNDVVLADRPRLASGNALEIFSSNRLNMFLGIRRDEMRPMLTELNFNIITRMVAGKRYYGEDLEYAEAKRFRDIISEIFELLGALSNPADFLPILRWIGFGNHEKKLKKITRETKAILQGLIDEHRSGNDKGSVDNNSMIDHLLSLQKTEPEYYTDDIIKGLVLVLILGGTDTSAATMEWAMTLLLNHPDVLEKAKVELDMHVGKDRLIEESDLPKLRYLQSIISETMRAFPVGPLLVPHMSSDDCQIGGFDIPRGTLLLVNAWALHRDPQVWEDPTSFKPERFENGEREDYKLVPFGIGRRACPGAGLAQRVVGLALGSLIQCYDWKKISNTAIDTTEGKGLSMPKLEPLEAMCKAREIINQVH